MIVKTVIINPKLIFCQNWYNPNNKYELVCSLYKAEMGEKGS